LTGQSREAIRERVGVEETPFSRLRTASPCHTLGVRRSATGPGSSLSVTNGNLTVSNLFRDRIRLVLQEMARGSAGFIRPADKGETVTDGQTRAAAVYRLQLNSIFDQEGKYATLAHELGHLYAGHLGTPNKDWWPDRRNLTSQEEEFEAESICYLVCGRAGITCKSESYLAGYLTAHNEVPRISLDRVLKAVSLIEEMGKDKLLPRKERVSPKRGQ
jgi:hypothetical protein